MPDFLQALQNGAANLWLFIPTAILLGALHGLEPGHSKTMMAAFIIAIRGTITQAILLGLAAAVSHSLVIWILAAGALHFGSSLEIEHIEPYLQIGSAVCVLALALWMFFRTRREVQEAHEHSHSHGDHHHHHHGHHDHAHGEAVKIETKAGQIELSIFEEDVPPVFQLKPAGGNPLGGVSRITVTTIRPDGGRQTFELVEKQAIYESRDSIPEPHDFAVEVAIETAGERLVHAAEFREETDEEYQDAHEREHAQEIEERFAGRTVTTPQIVLFGITGGLMPCPAAFTVLLVCLQLKRATLGFAMVGAFSFGLALTMVAVGVMAAYSVQHAQKRFRGFGEVMRRAPYFSCALLVVLSGYMAWQGWRGLHG